MVIGLGCMRLSTERDRDDDRARAVIAAAVRAGITLFDTADAYAHEDIGHNERLLRDVPGEIITKIGLTRPDGAWVPDGRAKHLDAAARASRDRLGRPVTCLLHAVDPRVPLETSVRALAKLRDAGVIASVGISNVNLTQLERALAITEITTIEVELSPFQLGPLQSGLVAACLARGIRVLAHRPLGGPAGARRLGVECETILAWLASKGVVPIPGATRVETIERIARANQMVLDADTIAALDARFLGARGAASDAEVVIVMGMPGAGKTTLAKTMTDHVRLNRDERGGSLSGLNHVLDRELAGGAKRVVLDNTYPTRASRAQVIAVARKHGASTRCIVVTTALEDAQHNAVARMLDQHGRLLEPGELRKAGNVPPGAQFKYRREYEPPRVDEGFDSVEEIVFQRRPRTAARRALIIELDDLVWRGRPATPDHIEVSPKLREQLVEFAAAGYLLAGTTWLTPATLDARLAELLGVPITVLRCAHAAGPPICWCRKPLPGLALAFAKSHDVDLTESIHIGRGAADRGFALRAGLRYVEA